jgi:hypothetical protein
MKATSCFLATVLLVSPSLVAQEPPRAVPTAPAGDADPFAPREGGGTPPAAAIDPAATGPLPAPPPQRVATFPYHPGDLILPGYRLTKRLGSGGFGEVWRAEAPGGMGVAIKILANLGRREGGREFRALQTIKNIRHAHIVPLFGVWLKTSTGRLLDDAELQAAEKRILSTPSPPAAHGIHDTHEADPEALEKWINEHEVALRALPLALARLVWVPRNLCPETQ